MKVEEKQDGQEETPLPEETTEGAAPEETQIGEADLGDELEAVAPSLQDALDEANDQLLRARADFDNYRKRVARDIERTRKMAAESLISDLLPALDNLELALQHSNSDSDGLFEGIEMVQKQFKQTLERYGLQPIAAKDEKFDPRIHEAVAHVPSDEDLKDRVTEECQRGYTLGDKVLRPSKVVVGAGQPEPQEENETSQNDGD